MNQGPRSPRHPIALARHATHRRLAPGEGRSDESGFTLIELVVVVAVLPIVVGAMVAGLLSIMNLTPTVTNKLSDSGDAEVLSASFTKDVSGASTVTAAPAAVNPSACGNGTQLVGLQYPTSQLISYSLVTQGSGPTAIQNLYRNACTTSGASVTVTSSAIVSHDVVNGSTGTGPPAASVTCTTPTATSCAGSPPAWETGWVSTAQVATISLPVTYVASNYKQTMVAAPSGGVNSGNQSSLNSAPYNCGFATANTGTYASTLCFVDFSGWNPPHTGTPTCGTNGYQITDGIEDTPFTISFCLTTTGGPIVAAAIPTYTDVGSSAFLGNNGFYTGIPGNPALYQNQNHTDSTITITNIQVLGGGGVPATNWNLITGDAESTDQQESISWTAGWSPTSTIPAGQQLFTLVDNTPGVSAIGNACANPTPGSGLTVGNGLTGVGTNSVTCAESVPSIKTGTVMISAPAPNSLTAFMVGGGLEGMFMGILLPS